MHYFGDISGNYGSLLAGDCDVVVHAVVAGEDEYAPGSCAKRAVRQLPNEKEAKWNELPPVEKRRVADSFAEKSEFINFQYAVVTRDDVNNMYSHYHLYDGEGPNADLLPRVIGRVYGVLFTDHLSSQESHEMASLVFDTVYSGDVSSEVVDEIEASIPSEFNLQKLDWGRSSSHHGIQTADCFAGMVAEDKLDLEDWSDNLQRAPAEDKSSIAHAAIEGLLHDLENE